MYLPISARWCREMFSDKIFTDIGINKETQQMDFTQNG